MSHANCLKSNAYINTNHDLYHNEQILVVAQILSCFLKAFANAIKNNSKLFKIGDPFSNRGLN